MPIGETVITVTGNLTADPELRHTSEGVPWLTFNVASNSRNWDKTTATWGEGRTLFLRCTAWRWLAENAEKTLVKGTRVVVTGALRQFDYTSADGVQRTGYGIDVEDVAVSLRYATATVQRTTRGNGQQAEDPWADARPARGKTTPWPGTGPAAGGDGFSEKPPF
ncbi:single-stranded DNA-binding protein [Streptomyces sp. SP17BM10]|uniref:single-stranded DNA-binding protein n=1 Tax=Streptomyces sp. SP17BM10 TaxID=3002530 RepID=UPI002E79B53D|nr:single-stranded DNA-binding protein [Streptomyces sp. SP17BM10]MEE1787744.1 single-stranded DNA-binding protein [Streptomyces sp. SP17BM10]